LAQQMAALKYLTGYVQRLKNAFQRSFYPTFLLPAPPQRPTTTATRNPAMTTVHDPDRKRALVLRLKRVEGQLRGIQKLIETDADCEKVAQQLAAARKALDKTFFTMVGCVIAQGDVPPDDVADMLARFS
jgi:CsoR family transcriptional regulator, copper-sensing transcriptional repressor